MFGIPTEVVVASIGLVGAVLPILLARKNNQLKAEREKITVRVRELEQLHDELEIKAKNVEDRAARAEAEINLVRQASMFSRFTREWSDNYSDIVRIQRETVIDRFVMLVATNSKYHAKWVSDILQIRDAATIPRTYRHLEIDEDYRTLLQIIQETGSHVVRTSDMNPHSLLRGIYDLEGVNESAIFHIDTVEDLQTGIAVISLCSFATTDSPDIDVDTLRRCRLMVARLKGLASSFPSAHADNDLVREGHKL